MIEPPAQIHAKYNFFYLSYDFVKTEACVINKLRSVDFCQAVHITNVNVCVEFPGLSFKTTV
jgi:hypothetical protein